jgi:hypothetical protein
MGDKLTLSDISNLRNEQSAIGVLTANNRAIESAIDNTLSRDGSTPNQMAADIDLNGNTLLNIDGLDMNSSRITGLLAAVADDEPVRKAEFDELNDVAAALDIAVADAQNAADNAATSAAAAQTAEAAAEAAANDAITTVAAVTGADVLVKTANGTLTAERVVEDSASVIWDWSVAGKVQARRAALSGDASVAENSNTLTLATVNGNVGTFGSATEAVQITVNGKGLVTALGALTVTPAVGSITGLGTGVAAFLATPSSANLAAAVTDETGTGSLVFANTPTLVTPDIGAATGTSVNLSSLGFFGGNVRVGTAAITQDASVEIGHGRSGDGHAYVDLHASSAQDYDGRLIRMSGENGILQLVQTGTGALQIASTNAGDIEFSTDSTVRFVIDSSGLVAVYDDIVPSNNDVAALGQPTLSWSDLYIASGGFINWDNGDVTITHAANNLIIAGGILTVSNLIQTNGASAGVQFDRRDAGVGAWTIYNPSGNLHFYDGADRLVLTPTALLPADDAVSLGSADAKWSNLHLGDGAAINWNNGDGTLTHAANALTLDGVDLTVNNDLNVGSAFRLTGDITPSQITANQNDYNPTGLSTASTLRLSTDAAREITGLAGGSDGRIIIIHNGGSNDLTLKDESASSSAANRFALSEDLILAADKSAILQYDSTSSRWRLLGGTGSGGGGGAPTTSQYVTLATDATLSNERVLTAGDGLTLTDGGAGGNATLAVGAGSGISVGADDISVNLSRSHLPTGSVLQCLQTTYATNTDLTTAIPYDDTSPGSAEGTQVLSQDITPTDNSNQILCLVHVWGDVDSVSGTVWSVALFRGTTCINAAAREDLNEQASGCVINHLDSPASASAVTYSVRVGPDSDNMRLNGKNSGRKFGGASKCTLTLMEIAA